MTPQISIESQVRKLEGGLKKSLQPFEPPIFLVMEVKELLTTLENTDTLELILNQPVLNAFQTFLPVLNECLAEEAIHLGNSQEFTQLNNLEYFYELRGRINDIFDVVHILHGLDSEEGTLSQIERMLEKLKRDIFGGKYNQTQ